MSTQPAVRLGQGSYERGYYPSTILPPAADHEMEIEFHKGGHPRTWYVRLSRVGGHAHLYLDRLSDIDAVLTYLGQARQQLAEAIRAAASTPEAIDGTVDALMRELGPEAVR